MLRRIEARNFFVFEDFSVDLPPGMAAITGETGAGKSMLLRLMELVLGDSFDYQLIRDHGQETRLLIAFDLAANAAARRWLDEQGLAGADASGLEILRAARYRKGTRAQINGRSIELGKLRELSGLLVEIMGQKARHSLHSSSSQLAAFDAYADEDGLLAKVREAAGAVARMRGEIAAIEGETPESAELLRYQYEELAKEALSEALWPELQAQHRRLSGYERMRADQEALAGLLDGDEEDSLDRRLHRGLELAGQLAEGDAAWQEVRDMIERARIDLAEARSEASRLRGRGDSEEDPVAALARVEERIGALFALARKHQIKPEELHRRQQELERRLGLVESQDETLARLRAEEEALLEEWRALSERLSDLRRGRVGDFVGEVNGTLAQLNMGYADFRVEFERRPEGEVHPAGRERLHFMVSTVAGKAHESINRVASGGELSRIGLAVRLCAARRNQASGTTLVFDEVDSGIGGRSAERLGRLIGALGQSQQILCVTHLANVAAYAKAQFLVSQEAGRASARLLPLDSKARTKELARMLTGDSKGQPSLKAADELLHKAARAS